MTGEPSFAAAYRQDPQQAVRLLSDRLREAVPADGTPAITDAEAAAVARLGLAGAVLAGLLSPDRLDVLLADPASLWRLRCAVTPNGASGSADSGNAATVPFVPGQATSDWLDAGAQGLLGEIRAPAEPRPGLVLGERFQLLNQIGQGGMGVVFQAVDQQAGRLVAVKVVFPGSLPQGLNDLLAEAAHAARVRSEHVAHPLAWGEGPQNSFAWFAMEYLEGATLLAHLHNQRPLGWPEAKRIVADVLKGMRDIHHAGLVHRDVKPGNVMATREGRWKVVDFGLALPRPYVGSAAFAAPAGTLRYLAPECWEHPAPFGPSSDLYAVGVVLAELLAAEPLFADGSSEALRQAHQAHDFAAGLPPVARPIVARATAKRPQDRYASADEFLTALDAARPPRRRWLPWAVAAAVLLLAVAGFWLLTRGRPEPVAYRGELNVLLAPPDRPLLAQPLGVRGMTAARVGSKVTIQGQLAEGQQGHHYLLAIDSRGKVDRLHPRGWGADALPADDARRLDFRWPAGGGQGRIDDAPAGLEAVVWLVRDRPLTRAANADIHELLAAVKWRQPTEWHAEEFPVYWENGLRVERRGPAAADGPLAEDPLTQTEKLLLALKERGLVQYSRAVCYPLVRP